MVLRRALARLRGRRPPSVPVVRRPQPPPMAPPSGRVLVSYSPRSDGRADPGEVVWTWVAYQDDPSRGKDRPVLVIGSRGGWLAGLMLTSKDRVDGRTDRWMDVGTGSWDRQRRP